MLELQHSQWRLWAEDSPSEPPTSEVMEDVTGTTEPESYVGFG